MAKRKRNAGQSKLTKAELRFAVIGELLSSPPRLGELGPELDRLAAKLWFDPHTSLMRQFGRSTIERWYYKARKTQSPIDRLTGKVRIDKGSSQLTEELIKEWRGLYEKHSHWSVQLLYVNFTTWAKVERKPPLDKVPSYSTMRRFYVQHGWMKLRKPRSREDGTLLPASVLAEARRVGIEIRSFEADYVGGLWHLDFHHGTRAILLEDGSWAFPLLLAIMDDRSRLICHAQWYLSESAENLIHGLIQGIQKRGLFAALMSDCGAAMKADEFVEGLIRLSIRHEPTLEYSPYQNGKQERFWQLVEGQLMKMIEDVQPLTLSTLNDLTQIWIEGSYHRAVHSEINTMPVERFAHDPSVLRESMSSDDLRSAFVREVRRTQRKTDGTMTLDGVRFEIPSAYRHIQDLFIHYARWDLSHVYLVDPETKKPVTRLLPLDRAKNASGKRAKHVAVKQSRMSVDDLMVRLPAQMRHLLKQSQVNNLPPAFVPQTADKKECDDGN